MTSASFLPLSLLPSWDWDLFVAKPIESYILVTMHSYSYFTLCVKNTIKLYKEKSCYLFNILVSERRKRGTIAQ